MKKLFCFFTVIFLAILMSVTVSAENGETSLSVKNSSSKSVCIDAFLDSDTPVCGGEFTLSFDEDSVFYGDIDSDLFDVEACENDNKVKIVIAKDECVTLSDEKPAFSVKFSKESKKEFDVQLTTEYLLNDNFQKIRPKKDCVTVAVDTQAISTSVSADKEKTVKSVSADNSKITPKEKKTTNAKDFLPIRIDGKSAGIKLIVAVGLLGVVTFFFGFVFKKFMTNKEAED